MKIFVFEFRFFDSKDVTKVYVGKFGVRIDTRRLTALHLSAKLLGSFWTGWFYSLNLQGCITEC